MRSKVQERILELVRNRWELQKRPFTLADLGFQLAREFSREEVQRELLGGKLKSYIEYNLGNELRIARHPTNPIVWGLVPKTVTDSEETLFAQAPSNTVNVRAIETGDRVSAAGDRPPYVRYDYDLWKAFTTEPAGDRYIELGERIVVRDLPKGSSGPANFFKLDFDDIADSQQGYTVVSRKIETWAERNKIDITKFKMAGRVGKKSLLEFMIEALSDEELRQLELPMNVIKILNSKRI